MQLETYSIVSTDEHKFYEFYSEGPKGRIKKVVIYRKAIGLRDNIFNLAFGDWDEKFQRLDDRVVSNNNDRQKILATVASTVLQFMKYHPDAIVYAEGSTPSRTRLYQMGITAYLSEISKHLDVYGFRLEDWEPFQPGKNFEAFAVKIKM
jgi:hypothetical protein